MQILFLHLTIDIISKLYILLLILSHWRYYITDFINNARMHLEWNKLNNINGYLR